MGTEPGSAGAVGDDEARLLQRIWQAVEAPERRDAAASAGNETRADEASRSDARAAPLPSPAAADADGAEGPEHPRLLQSARAVHALNQRLGLDMDAPAHRLARDRMTAFVAKVSALSGVRPDELVIGSGSDAFVVQNGADGRTIAKFDTHDAVNTPVGDSLAGLAAAARQPPSGDASQQPGLEQQGSPKPPVLV